MSQDLHQSSQPQPAQPVMLRPCQECQAPMLLMSALFQRAGFVTKLYECYVCRKTEEIMALPTDA